MTGIANLVTTILGNIVNSITAGDPVNIANGDVNSVETDFVLPGIGMSLTFARRYDSQNSADVGMGVGWVFSYSDHLSFLAGGSIIWTDDQDHQYTFTPDGQGGYTVPTTLFGTFTASASGYTFRDKNGLVHQFDTQGQLVDIRDRNGNEQDVAYDASGHITTVTEAGATERQLIFTYTGNHITAVSDGTGRTWTYSYTGNELTEANAPSDAQTPQATVLYAYYTDAALGGLLEQVTEPNGGTSQFTYYGNRRAFQVTDPDGYTNTYSFNLYTNQTAFTDELGNTTLYGYNSAGNEVSVQHPDRARETFVWQNNLLTSDTDAFGQTETFQYDANGNVTTFTDRAGNVTTYTYDPTFSQVTSITQPGGRVTQNVYDANGNLVKSTDAMGDVTTMTRDAHGELTSVTKPRGNQGGTPGEFTTTYTYNDAGQVLTIATALPSTEVFTYDTRGHLTSVTDADGNTTTYAYDLLDRLTSTTDPLGETSTNVYDAIGNLIATTDRLGRTMHFDYDLKRQLVETINADGTILTGQFGPTGNLTEQTDELGRLTQSVFDDRNRLIDTIYADGSTAQTRYDGGSRIKAVTDAPATPPRLPTTRSIAR